MRLPNRKPGKYTFPQFDPHITAAKLQELQQALVSAQKKLPHAIREVQQYAENGDFSENAEYQVAKGRLRGLNKNVAELQYQINHAIIIASPIGTHTVQVGHHVTVEFKGETKTFTILGSVEANPAAGIISYHSPVGAALLGHKVGDIVMITTGNGDIAYTIIDIFCQV
ncbi:MAG: hypothetical protein ACD_41C00004G0001 [uncultured bacterium]|nr:MAG: hypothetical protein ACD_41C00004G0001 [uncultured bacterium]